MRIEELRNSGLIAYEYIRGSHLFGLNTEESDVDLGGVYIAPIENILGLNRFYEQQIGDKKGDTVFYELGRWIELLTTSNPTALEGLFAPKDKVIGEIHPIVQYIIDNRSLFLTKDAFKPLIGYSYSQIQKARGLNKKCNVPIIEKKSLLDFCYTFDKQGSKPLKEWLEENHLDQRYIGLVNVPNMRDEYGVYYDFAAYFHFENIDYHSSDFKVGIYFPFDKFITETEEENIQQRIKDKEFYHYKGIVEPDDETKSNEVRLSSIPKGEKPICFISYNKDAYTKHLKDYKEYQEWVENRNPVRYENNKGHNYDSKNLCHTVRLMHMGLELARDGQFNVVRTWDRDFLMKIRRHEFSYNEIMEYVESKQKEMEEAMAKSTLPEHVDIEKVNNLLIEARKQQLNYGN